MYILYTYNEDNGMLQFFEEYESKREMLTALDSLQAKNIETHWEEE